MKRYSQRFAKEWGHPTLGGSFFLFKNPLVDKPDHQDNGDDDGADDEFHGRDFWKTKSIGVGFFRGFRSLILVTQIRST